MRGMRAAAWPDDLPPRRWALVGSGARHLAGRAGRQIRGALEVEDLPVQVRTTRVVLATAHRDHDATNNRPRNLVALCQRCHLQYDREAHRRRRWLTLFRRKALGDLFLGRYR